MNRRVYAFVLKRNLRKIGNKIFAAFVALCGKTNHLLADVKAVKFPVICIVVSLAATNIKNRALHFFAYGIFEHIIVTLCQKIMPCMCGLLAVALFVAAFVGEEQVNIPLP